jgi:hypothetical protein
VPLPQLTTSQAFFGAVGEEQAAAAITAAAETSKASERRSVIFGPLFGWVWEKLHLEGM